LEEKVEALVYKAPNTAVGICRADNATPSYLQKFGINFADKR
jgi:hypothetical protein